MSSLSNEQKELLFNYCLGLTSEKEAEEAQRLISSDNEASELYSTIKAALSPLESIQPEPSLQVVLAKSIAITGSCLETTPLLRYSSLRP